MAHRSALALLLAALLAACSSGGSGGDPATVESQETVPVEPTPFDVVDDPPQEQPASEPNPTPEPIPDLVPPESVPDSEPVPPPVVEPPPIERPSDDAPENETQVLGDLYGEVAFLYSFAGDDATEFFYVVDYDVFDLNVTDGGRPFLLSLGQAAFSEMEGEILPGPFVEIGCLYNILDELFVCLADVTGELLTAFVFPRPFGGVSFGTFEFCGSLETSDCAVAALSEPDGEVFVAITEPSAATRNGDSARGTGTLDPLPYLRYLNQGTSNEVSTPAPFKGVALTDAFADLAKAIGGR